MTDTQPSDFFDYAGAIEDLYERFERARKWIALQSGQIDAVVLSTDALARTKMNEAAVVRYVEEVEAVQRSIALRRRALEEQAKNEKAKDKLSERDRALRLPAAALGGLLFSLPLQLPWLVESITGGDAASLSGLWATRAALPSAA